MHDLLFRNALVFDGTGNPPAINDVAVTDGRIAAIGRSGFMTHAETEKSIDLFAREVLPRLKEIAPVQAGFNQ